MRAGNNVAWRNVNFVEVAVRPYAHFMTYPFNFAGAEELDLRFDFHIVQNLPLGATARLRVPRDFALTQQNALRAERDKEEGMMVLTVPAVQSLKLPQVLVPGGARYRSALLLEVAAGVVLDGHNITIRQLYRGLEVGRVSWRFHRRVDEA